MANACEPLHASRRYSRVQTPQLDRTENYESGGQDKTRDRYRLHLTDLPVAYVPTNWEPSISRCSDPSLSVNSKYAVVHRPDQDSATIQSGQPSLPTPGRSPPHLLPLKTPWLRQLGSPTRQSSPSPAPLCTCSSRATRASEVLSPTQWSSPPAPGPAPPPLPPTPLCTLASFVSPQTWVCFKFPVFSISRRSRCELTAHGGAGCPIPIDLSQLVTGCGT